MTTKRSLAEIYTLLADNTTGLISAEDVRDLVATVEPDYGSMHIDTAIETEISDSVSYHPTLGIWALETGALDWAMGTNGQLQYTGTASRICKMFATCSMTGAANNITADLALMLSGVVMLDTRVRRKIGTGSDVGAVAIMGTTVIAPGEYLELGIRNETDTENITLETANLFTIGMAL